MEIRFVGERRPLRCTYKDTVLAAAQWRGAAAIRDNYRADILGDTISTAQDFTTIDVPGAGATLAVGINNNGLIVGAYYPASGEYGFSGQRRRFFIH